MISNENVMFNATKHHLEAMIAQIHYYAQKGEIATEQFCQDLEDAGLREVYKGTVDVYTGKLSAAQIKEEVLQFVHGKNITSCTEYTKYLEAHGTIKRIGYYIMLSLSDNTEITLRLADNPQQFIHAHPGRFSPNTFRTRAQVLKTAIVAQFFAVCRQCSAKDLEIINLARVALNFSPVNDQASKIFEVLDTIATSSKLL
ncbi:hypothetical protein [Candidatus Uabimicrobium sp. HlEnr_7]|uniref:hypothetical protein n=1 Tax=Candidatus Uabimicrobium helgolandensis TaxID=3095367 RepID=UPI0035586638